MAAKLRAAKRRKNRDELLMMGGAVWYLYMRRQQKTNRSLWCRDWLLRRDDLGAYEKLLSELREEDTGSFLNFLRMSPGLYEDLLGKVTPYIKRQDTSFRKAISAGLRLAVTLRFLATGESFKSLSYMFCVGNNTIGLIVPETCLAIYEVLKDDYFKCPTTIAEWKSVAEDFLDQWNFPNCVGALDGKHVMIRKPGCSGSKFYNYKHFFSVVLLALVDANYKFLFVDVGAQGRCSDAGIFAECDLNLALQTNCLGMPPPSPLPCTDQEFPYCIVADDAFPLRPSIMKPYPHCNLEKKQRIYNYRLSRARRCVENAFGIMSNRFRVLLNPICLSPGKVDGIILACCSLHNMLRTVVPTKYVCSPDDDEKVNRPSRSGINRPARVAGRRSCTQTAKQLRDQLCQYFSSEQGSVRWQDSML